VEAFQAAVTELETHAMQHAQVSEGKKLGHNVREKLFKTRQGRRYRLLYSVAGTDVRVLRVRGPGQPPVRRRDLK
jgi:hypothetical protein